jgi:hypothetical protein
MVLALSLFLALSAIRSVDAYTTRELPPKKFRSGESMQGTTKFSIVRPPVVECEESSIASYICSRSRVSCSVAIHAHFT